MPQGETTGQLNENQKENVKETIVLGQQRICIIHKQSFLRQLALKW